MNIAPHILKAIHAADDPMRYACQLGRAQARVEEHRRMMVLTTPQRSQPKTETAHQNNLCLNGEGLRGLKRDAFRLALRECGGSVGLAAERLMVTRSTAFEMAKRYGTE